jgi:hypothetical protein
MAEVGPEDLGTSRSGTSSAPAAGTKAIRIMAINIRRDMGALFLEN